mmetsp:Transcript_7936/g.29616  ORF Transcript_7936/g.29616 Transcript_7936/m.29616 type:complete len:118 (+) Transcript_7936:348-701(+)|eukprot:CAMPEP_0117440396 /NCGR_PEP_ID=MMETSP0759-20121206/3070_1 /TAXON_ID=63605 /ORGANISM="Percolomonas cosmopolitus, Strain WS" /LENGTH=117 /DNA_ID=CAMNT_0005232163 /DNA_START=333 /DNA_END=686 /DNA_ORIENTATION=-
MSRHSLLGVPLRRTLYICLRCTKECDSKEDLEDHIIKYSHRESKQALKEQHNDYKQELDDARNTGDEDKINRAERNYKTANMRLALLIKSKRIKREARRDRVAELIHGMSELSMSRG